jgi:hypothetical protein
MSFSKDKFEDAMRDVFLLRGWRETNKDRFKAIFEMYRLYKFHLDDLKYAINRIQQDDNFDERTLMFYLRESKRRREPGGEDFKRDDYEAVMLRDVGPNWKDLNKRCWAFVTKCMGSVGSRSEHFQNHAPLVLEDVDVESFRKEMAEEFPGLGFDKR